MWQHLEVEKLVEGQSEKDLNVHLPAEERHSCRNPETAIE
jgi:hypothetical protein